MYLNHPYLTLGQIFSALPFYADHQEEIETAIETDTNRWQWQAPDTPGLTSVIIESPNKKQRMVINVFVKVPADKVEGGKLKYYQIGHYPKPSQIKDSKHYIVPDGFVEVTPENESTKLSPHFSLKEFVSKQKSNHPKYLFLQSKLLLKLEIIRKELILEGIPVSNMVVMSGYRTPYYNRAIGNVKLSRHVFGDAAPRWRRCGSRDRTGRCHRARRSKRPTPSS